MVQSPVESHHNWFVLSTSGWLICTIVMIILENWHIYYMLSSDTMNCRLVKISVRTVRAITAAINLIPVISLVLFQDINIPEKSYPGYNKLWVFVNVLMAPFNIAYWSTSKFSVNLFILTSVNIAINFVIIQNIFVINSVTCGK